MTYGFNPHMMEWSPFHGAIYAVVEAAAKMVALGGRYDKIRLTFQEYFESLGKDSEKSGASLLLLFWVRSERSMNSGFRQSRKDSMSGTFEDISVHHR